MTLSVRSLEMSTQAIQLTVSTLAVSFGSERSKFNTSYKQLQYLSGCAVSLNPSRRSNPLAEPYFFLSETLSLASIYEIAVSYT